MRQILFRNSTGIIASGFLCVLLLMLVITVTGLSRMGEIKAMVDVVSDVHHVKAQILTRMHQIVAGRTLAMYAMLVTEDPFVEDEEYIHFRRLGADFIELRSRLEALGLSPEEQSAFDDTLALIRISSPLQNSIVDALKSGEKAAVMPRIAGEDLVLEKRVLAMLDRMMRIEHQATQDALAAAGAEYRRAYLWMSALNAVTLLLATLIAWGVIARTRGIERALHAQKEQAEVTLHGIGDAVIATDTAGRVAYLNPVAEQLTGWRAEDARGRPLDAIYHVVHEQSRAPVPDPLAQGALDGRIVRLDQHTVLIGRDGAEYAVEDSLAPIRDRSGATLGHVVVFRDVTRTRELSHRLSWQASHDALTGLVNRRGFEQFLEQMIQEARTQRATHSLLYVDLDQFKLVNDTCGHVAGDEMLKHLAVILRREIRENDTLARLGGDEFGVLLRGCDGEQALQIAEKLRAAVQQFRFVWQDKSFRIGASIGAVTLDAHAKDLASLLSAADAACFVAKDQGRNRVWMHRVGDREIVRRQSEMRLVQWVQRALEQGRLQLFRQEIRPLQGDADGPHCELLVRMLDEQGQPVPPMAFIPAAERYGIMKDVDRWVIRQAFDCVRMPGGQLECHALVGVNVSGQSLGDDGFLDFVAEQFARSGVDPRRICFEITETAAIANWHKAQHVIDRLRERGCRFALDDFGNGMSSFSYLKNLPVDFIKLDGAFVRDIDRDEVNLAMVKSIHHIGRVMGIATVAEFVETGAVLERLTRLGIAYGQGFAIHRPEPLTPPGRLPLDALGV